MTTAPTNQERQMTGRVLIGGQYTHFENGSLTEDLVKEVAGFLFRVARKSLATARMAALWADELVLYRDVRGVLMGVHGFRFLEIGEGEQGYRVIYTVFSVVDERAENAKAQVGQVGVRVYGRERQRRPRLPIVWASLSGSAAGQGAPGGMQDARRLVTKSTSTLPHTMRFYTDLSAQPGLSDEVPAVVEGAVATLAKEQRELETDAQLNRPIAESRWKRMALRFGAVAAAAGAMILLVSTQLHQKAFHEEVGNREKGDLLPQLRVYRQAGDGSEEVLSGAKFAAGDNLRFTIDLRQPSHVQILGVQADGTLYLAWPLAGMHNPAVMERGSQQLLDGAVSLDNSVGHETLHLVACTPDVLDPACRSNGPLAPPSCAPGCTLTSFSLDKSATR